MSRITFEYFGLIARSTDDHTLAAGRYASQRKTEKNIVPDVIKKLELKATDRLLDVGCGTGNISIPISRVVKEVVVVDHPSVIDSFKKRCDSKNIHFIPGNFFDVDLTGKFDKILCYSVLHYLADMDEVMSFIRRTLFLLALGGMILFGDIPNKSNQYRLSMMERWSAFYRSWWQRLFGRKLHLPPCNDQKLVRFTNEEIMEICYQLRDAGYKPYILPHAKNLPFWGITEDILVKSNW